ncbi:MAG TPA: DUF4198 domain-containing protein [Magnetospirillaceae bacterium]|nr:DUF4198 domain-containing protein [Magnetospirillaceae bacterium]
MLLFALLLALPAAAHDFWIQPEAPHDLLVGHGPYRQISPIPPSRITRFETIGPANGPHLLVLETDDKAQSHLPAIRFNDYLQSEGLTPALEERQRTGRGNRDGSERYSRRAKALIGAGPGDALFTKRFGLTLEIVPERSASALPVQIFYKDQPLAGALVKLTDLDHDEQPFETHRTDQDGRASFTLPAKGSWLLNVIWTEALGPAAETDFATVFSSLSFTFPER